MRRAPRLPLRHAVALGLLQGPTELLPVSSSGHTTLLPWLAGWPYADLDPRLRKSFEVALHAGTAAALIVHPPGGERHVEVPLAAGTAGRPTRAGLRCVAGAVGVPALAGYTLGRRIERGFGTPASIAGGLLAGSAAMIAAERHSANPPREAHDAGALDGLLLGFAQALALMPGVSRSGATLATARARGFSREDADRLSWQVGLPVIASAALLKGGRLAHEGTPRELRLPFAVGSTSAFVSTLAGSRILGARRRASLVSACAVYRAALALLVIRRMRDNTC